MYINLPRSKSSASPGTIHFKTDELIAETEKELEQIHYDLKHLVEYTIKWYEHLRTKYGEGRDRKTIISEFENIQAHAVVANNTKLYVDEKGIHRMGFEKDGNNFCMLNVLISMMWWHFGRW